MVLAIVGLAAALAASDSLPRPAAVVDSSGSMVRPAMVAVHNQPAIPIVALRMSLLVNDPPGFAGAGHLFQHLMLSSLQERAGRVGGRVQMERNSDALVYTVIGPADELDYLVEVLHSALRVPSASPGAMVVAMHELAEERLAEWETAAAHVRAELRSRLFPEDLPMAGTTSSAARFDVGLLRALWGEIYRPDRVSIVAVGDVNLARVQAAFSDLPAPPRERLRETFPDTVPVTRLAVAQATQAWLGVGYSASDADPVALTVTAQLLRDLLRERLPRANVEVEHWWTHHGQALAVVISGPESGMPAARRAVGTAIAALQQDVDGAKVRAAATAVRREMLFYTRTPERMAEVVGRFADRDGSPDAAQQFFANLERVSEEDVMETVDRLADRTPTRVELAPQALRRGQ